MKYAFIADNQQSWPVSILCEVLRNGFYAYRKRQAAPSPSPHDIALLERIKAISEKRAQL